MVLNDRYIAKQIILSQIASDGGKNILEIKSLLSLGKLYYKKGYNVKDFCIIKAIKCIQKSKNSNFRFYVKEDYFSRNLQKYCYIVYFNFKYSNKNFQVSFHSFSRKLGNYCNEKFITRWKKRVSSRDACILLNSIYLS